MKISEAEGLRFDLVGVFGCVGGVVVAVGLGWVGLEGGSYGGNVSDYQALLMFTQLAPAGECCG